MSTILDIAEMVAFIKGAKSKFTKAAAKAHTQTVLAAKAQAIINAKRQFTGRHGRRLSGALFNSIYVEFDTGDGDIPVGVLGVRNIPYGAIHEYGSGGLPGGVIRPVKAQKLWIPNYRKVGKMTPREFVRKMKSDPSGYYISPKSAGEVRGRHVIPLFYRVDKVRIPARPYLTPAVEQEVEKYPERYARWVQKEFK